jgi:hypothetical protein
MPSDAIDSVPAALLGLLWLLPFALDLLVGDVLNEAIGLFFVSFWTLQAQFVGLIFFV